MGNEALLLLLVIGWAAVLLPGALRSRMRSAHTTVGGFERAMDVLRRRADGREILVPRGADGAEGIVRSGPGASGRGARAGVARPQPRRTVRRPSPILERRRLWFVRLVVATVILLSAAVFLGGVLWTLTLLCVGVLAGYVALLRHFKVEQDRAREVVRTIDLVAHEGRFGGPAEEVEEERYAVAVEEERYAVAVGEGVSLQVATRDDEPWHPHAGVRIRRWNA